ncbi:MAG: glycoside hydrolase family 3 C-terminal domain-containing protein, partial [Candidatus Limivicinus sp.]|nr:glycoside hydrolase family 3 C-terminal domain-containing protein [Candidatus Limivicinus sp.]
QKALALVSQMTLEEKASLCSGKNFWESTAVERLGVHSFMLTDGPHGLRKQAGEADHLGQNASVPATCFPPAAATACSFDPELMERMGQAMGDECRAEKVSVLLGPAANIKRSPLCGRNFEYFSEDPLLTGEIAAGLIRGIQSRNVGACMKHYLANNQERARVSSDSVVDERALREIYLAGYETAVKKARPWTLMCSYNKINGTYASDNKRLMTDVPRGEWGFEGAIMTDWGAMNDRVEAIKAGLDLEMPGPCDGNDALIVQAVREGRLTEEQVDVCAVRVTELALRAEENAVIAYDRNAHHELVRQIARESAVLLRKGSALPLKKGAKLAVIGDFARNPRYQGAGSSKINPTQLTSLCDALDERKIEYTYAQGFAAEGKPDAALVDEAVSAAKKADVAVVMLGLPDSFESEGFDRAHIDLPENQTLLMSALMETGTPLAVVLSTGAAVLLPWREQVDSILLMYLGGQNSGSAVLDLLLGEVSPCGRLSETWPLALEDTPCHGFYGNKGNVEYRESVYVGYRYYDKAGKEVAYPFGHGLSYTSFAYSDLQLSAAEINENDPLTVSVTVTNTGSITGKEVVQLYIAPPCDGIFRPVRELRAFAKVELAPGESRTVSLTLDRRAFAYYDAQGGDWRVDSGIYTVELGYSSRDIRLSQPVTVQGAEVNTAYTGKVPAYDDPAACWPVPKEQFEVVLGRPVPPERPIRPFTVNSTLSQLRTCFLGHLFWMLVKKVASKQFGGEGSADDFARMVDAMLEDMPLRQLAMVSGGALTPGIMAGLVDMMNGHFIRGLTKMKR